MRSWHECTRRWVALVCVAYGMWLVPSFPSGSAAEFHEARAGYRFEFPRDHGTHDDFRTEWWYYTGQLKTEDGRRFGFELTFFRRTVEPDLVGTNASRWALHQLYLAHVALSDLDRQRFLYGEKISRAGIGKAGADSGRLHVWIDRWSADAPALPAGEHRLRAQTKEFGLELALTPEKPPIIHGAQGVSRKGAGPNAGSHYYSLTRLATAGTVTVEGVRHPVTGLGWMDHEFGSGDLGEDLVGWDWYSIQLASRTEIMIYRLRRADGTVDAASSGTVVRPDGRTLPLSAADVHVDVLGYWDSPVSRARYPSGWRLRIPAADLSLTIEPLLAQQELVTNRSTQVTYWEGAVRVTGTDRSGPVEGQGYVELTGYAKPFRNGR